MWNVNDNPTLRVGTLKELDALVGQYLTGEPPRTYWEEQHACLRFETIDEALEALHDPYFQKFIPLGARPHTSLTEVREFRCYSTDLKITWELVERMADSRHSLRIRREKARWIVSFGESPSASSHSAPVAICLAALRSRGIDVDLAHEWTSPPPDGADARAVA